MWSDYYFMTECFADKIYEIYEPGDVIMVHDYHLMMLPRRLRQRLPDAHITFSLHTPCHRIPRMPWQLREFFTGILGSNLITFLQPQDAIDYAAWCARIASDQPSHWATRATDSCISVPMGIDTPSIISAAHSVAVGEKCDALRINFADRKIVLSYGTVDYQAEMNEVCRGFRQMCRQCPWWRDWVTLIEVVCSSRAVDAFQEYSIIDLVGDIGEGTIWTKACVSEDDFHALLACCDAVIFPYTPGGPMTAALEYHVCQPRGYKKPIISDTHPALYQVPRAIKYRSGDVGSIACAIDFALRLPGGRFMRTPRLEDYDPDKINSAESWTRFVLRHLMRVLLRDRGGVSTVDDGESLPAEFTGG
ncbi:hypothetical protein ACQKWADRAFT_296740 [Trichoderma austrokoningii]